MKIYAITALVGLAAAPAFAGDLSTTPVEPQPQVLTQAAPLNYGGDWTGAYAGIQLGYGDVGTTGGALDGDGAIGGAHVGYNYDFGNYVLGAELDHNISNIDLGAAAGELDSVTRLKGKVGYDAGRTLYYGVLGAAHAEATVGGAGLSESGYLVGLGADYMLTDNIVLGGDVIYHDFGDFDGSGVEVDATTVQARLSFKF